MDKLIVSSVYLPLGGNEVNFVHVEESLPLFFWCQFLLVYIIYDIVVADRFFCLLVRRAGLVANGFLCFFWLLFLLLFLFIFLFFLVLVLLLHISDHSQHFVHILDV